MDFSYYKYLFYIKKLDKVSYKELCNQFGLSKNDAQNILQTFSSNEFIKFYGDTYYTVTFKSKYFIKSFIFKWIFNNLLAIIAIIISIIALFK